MADAATSDSRSGGDSASPARSPSPPSAPPLSEADRKRLRHRAYVKKSYNKKLVRRAGHGGTPRPTLQRR